MKRDLLNLICSPCCRTELRLQTKKVLINNTIENKYEDIIEGVLCCLSCNKEYPIIDGVPRLCTELWREEIRKLQSLKEAMDSVIQKENKKREHNNYVEIEKRIRQRLSLPTNASNYLKRRIENDIYYRVKGCEKQEKYIHTLKLYYDKKKVEAILDVGGWTGRLNQMFF